LSATIASEFGSLTIISWLGSAYLISLATVQPLSGKLTDIFGRRPGLICCLAFFALGNAICGLAHSKEVMILGRVLAGIGGGGCISISTFISSDLIPLRRRGMWHGVGHITYSAGIGLGGVGGGVINDSWGWRWAFLVIIPFTIISGIGVAVFLPDHAPQKEKNIKAGLRRIDFGGSIVLVSALVLLLYGLNHEDSTGAPSPLLLKVTLPMAAVLFAAFVVIETCFVAEPIIQVTLLRLRTVSGVCLASWFNSMGMYTLMFYVPLYFQLRGYRTSETGIRLLPEAVGAAIGSFGAGLTSRLTGRYGFSKVIVLGLFIGGAGGFFTCTINTAALLPETYLLMNGMGFGGMLTVMLLALLSAVDHQHQAVTTAMLYAFRSAGATIGVTASGILFRQVLASQLQGNQVSDMPASGSNSGLRGLEQNFRECSRRHDNEPSNCPPKLLDAYMYALHATFLLAMSFAIAGFISGMATKNYQLRTTLDREEGDGQRGRSNTEDDEHATG
jgi:predicted MFS family arabinose efflux permease